MDRDDLPRLIETPEDLDRAMSWLIATEPRFGSVYETTGPLPLRRKPEGFAQLLSAIVSQQVSTASAAAIWARIDGAGMVFENKVAGASDEDLRALGLSRPKVRYVKALAAAGIDYAALRDAEDADVMARLTAVSGIGPWTAEIYLLSSLGRADVFPHADIALQEAARVMLDLPDRPDAKAMAEIASAWSPVRAVAARALWAYYRHIKGREGIR